MRIRVSVTGIVMFFLAASTAAAQQLKPPPVQDEELVTDTIHYTQRVRLVICCGPGGPTATSASSKPVLKHATSVNRSSFSDCDPRAGELFLLVKRLLSERGSIGFDSEQKTFTVTDRRAAVESIRQLVESHALRSSLTDAAGSDASKSSVAIRAVLDAQVAAWNRADIEGYMDGYDRSPQTRIFFGENFQSWQDALERHKKTYDTREKMGVLTFLEVEVAMVSKDAALVFGRLHLQQVNDEPHGRFTLLFKKTKVGWRIVYDHTSSA